MSLEHPTTPRPGPRRGSEAVMLVLVLVAALALLTMVVVDRLGSGDAGPTAEAATGDGTATTVAGAGAAGGEGAAPANLNAASASTTLPAGATPPEQAIDAEELPGGPCKTEGETLRPGASGKSVLCLQRALVAAGVLSGEPSGTYDNATYAAVRKLQEQRNLFVDGIAGRETALSLGVWPDEQSFVVRTPPPPPGAVDAMGFPLSSVASTGASAPPLPANSGSGRRLVYERKSQRVWAVDKDDNVIRSFLVTGSQYNNEVPGVHKVYSRSEMSTAWNGKAFLPKMIRYYRTKIGHIGFHAIPLHVKDRTPYQTEAQLGTRLSGGCQRVANLDANFLWQFAQVGTTVVVL